MNIRHPSILKDLLIPAVAWICLNGAWGAIAHGATTEIKDPVTIKGQVSDIRQTTSASGYSFQVDFRNISYDGKVERMLIEEKDDGKVTIWLSLRNTVLTVQQTDISGGRRSATCGPIRMVLGKKNELWLAMDVERKVEDGQHKHVLIRTRFGLPQNNLSVGTPSWVRTSGLGMTESRVVNGLTSGIAESTKNIEAKLIQEAPKIFAQLKAHLPLTAALKQISAQ